MTPTHALPAVIVGGAVNTLSIARSLGRQGIPVDVLADARAPLAVRHSRYCRRYVEAGAPLQERWLDWLLGEGATEPAILLPASDEGLELLARNRCALAERGHRPFEANDEIILAMLDKARTYELAARHGVPAPQALLLSSGDDVRAAKGSVQYPALLKPRHSHVYLRAFPPERKGTVVSSDAEMEAVAAPIVDADVAMVLTELIPGRHDAYCSYYTYLDDEGQPLVHVTKRKLRQFPVGFGEGTYHQMASEPEAAALGLPFFQAVGLRGLGNVEFKRDERDGALKLIECNLRFTQADALLQGAGIDLPLLSYARLAGWPIPAFGPQRNGLHLWVPRNDVKAFLAYRRSGQMTTTEWLRTLAGRQCPLLFDRRDLSPFLHGLGRRATSIPRKVAARPRSR